MPCFHERGPTALLSRRRVVGDGRVQNSSFLTLPTVARQIIYQALFSDPKIEFRPFRGFYMARCTQGQILQSCVQCFREGAELYLSHATLRLHKGVVAAFMLHAVRFSEVTTPILEFCSPKGLERLVEMEGLRKFQHLKVIDLGIVGHSDTFGKILGRPNSVISNVKRMPCWPFLQEILRTERSTDLFLYLRVATDHPNIHDHEYTVSSKLHQDDTC